MTERYKYYCYKTFQPTKKQQLYDSSRPHEIYLCFCYMLMYYIDIGILSVRLSCFGIVLKWLNMSSQFLHHKVAQSL